LVIHGSWLGLQRVGRSSAEIPIHISTKGGWVRRMPRRRPTSSRTFLIIAAILYSPVHWRLSWLVLPVKVRAKSGIADEVRGIADVAHEPLLLRRVRARVVLARALHEDRRRRQPGEPARDHRERIGADVRGTAVASLLAHDVNGQHTVEFGRPPREMGVGYGALPDRIGEDRPPRSGNSPRAAMSASAVDCTPAPSDRRTRRFG
jgi:hypothetical protein